MRGRSTQSLPPGRAQRLPLAVPFNPSQTEGSDDEASSDGSANPWRGQGDQPPPPPPPGAPDAGAAPGPSGASQGDRGRPGGRGTGPRSRGSRGGGSWRGSGKKPWQGATRERQLASAAMWGATWWSDINAWRIKCLRNAWCALVALSRVTSAHPQLDSAGMYDADATVGKPSPSPPPSRTPSALFSLDPLEVSHFPKGGYSCLF